MHNTLLADERSVIADLSWLSEGYAQKVSRHKLPLPSLVGSILLAKEGSRSRASGSACVRTLGLAGPVRFCSCSQTSHRCQPRRRRQRCSPRKNFLSPPLCGCPLGTRASRDCWVCRPGPWLDRGQPPTAHFAMP